MKPVWRVSDVRAAEAGLMATVAPGTLMQRAAAGLARRCALLLADRGGVYGARVLVLVGTGDNGGDALYAGERLARRGAQVAVLPTSPGRAHAEGLAALRAAGGRLVDAPPPTVDLVLDGIVGIGGSGGLREAADELVADLPALRGRDGGRAAVVAVDVPSGVAVDTGDVPTGGSGRPGAVRADVTVAFGALKPALVVGPAAPLAGQVELVDIGLGPWLRGTPALWVTESSACGTGGPAPGRPRRSTAGAWSGWPPGRGPTRGRGCSRWVARWPAPPAWSGTPVAPRPRWSGSTRR